MNSAKDKDIERLLVRFEQGETSEAEEARLRDFFCQTENVPSEWIPYRELFRSFDTAAYDFTDEELDAMMADCDALPVENPHRPSVVPFTRRWHFAAAAAVVCALGISALLYTYNKPDAPVADGPSTALLPRTASAPQPSPAPADRPIPDGRGVTPSAQALAHVRTVPAAASGTTAAQHADPRTDSISPGRTEEPEDGSSVHASLSGTVAIAGMEIRVAYSHPALAMHPYEMPEAVQAASIFETQADTVLSDREYEPALASACAQEILSPRPSASLSQSLSQAQLMPGYIPCLGEMQ